MYFTCCSSVFSTTFKSFNCSCRCVHVWLQQPSSLSSSSSSHHPRSNQNQLNILVYLLKDHCSFSLVSLFGNHKNIYTFQRKGSKTLTRRDKTLEGLQSSLPEASAPVSWCWPGLVSGGLAPSVCGCSTLPVKDRLVDSASPVYQAVQSAEKEPDPSERGRRSANMQSKSFQVLAHMTRTESSKFPVLVLSCFISFDFNFHGIKWRI